MINLKLNGKKLEVDGIKITCDFEILEAVICEEVVVVLIDPDAYIGKAKIRNLLGYNLNGDKIWQAAYPRNFGSDYYWKIQSSSPLIVSSFSSYDCEISPLSGRIVDKKFYK